MRKKGSRRRRICGGHEATSRRGEYYAQPRNAVWPIMGDLCGAGPDLPYAERTSRLIERRIAVRDVCATAS